MAMLITLAMVTGGSRSAPSKQASQEAAVKQMLSAFKQAGWKIERASELADSEVELIVRRGEHAYLVVVNSAPEARRDRVLPLLALTILQAQAIARRHSNPPTPLAIIRTHRVSEALARDVKDFAQEFAHDIAVGLIDSEGFQWFRGTGLQSLNAQSHRPDRRIRALVADAAPQLFSDLNQWMLKVLLAPHIQADLLSAPRVDCRNASQLAAIAGVSVMSAYRFVRQLHAAGFLNESVRTLELVRVEELLQRWRAANLRPMREIGLRWTLRGTPTRQLHEALRDQTQKPKARGHRRGLTTPRACLALFAAADALGLGFVHGVPPHIYVEKLDPAFLQSLGLSLEQPTDSPDVYVRMPAAPESVFRGTVLRGGIPVCDVLQVWLDTSAHPARGAEQADLIYRRVLSPSSRASHHDRRSRL
jgi:hypothetical protein